MSKFYGTVKGSASSRATRTGSKDISVSAQSYDGSVIVRLYYNNDNELSVDIETTALSLPYGRQIFSGTFDEFNRKLAR